MYITKTFFPVLSCAALVLKAWSMLCLHEWGRRYVSTDGKNKNASPEMIWPLSGQQAEGHAAGVKLHLQRCPFVILSSEYH